MTQAIKTNDDFIYWFCDQSANKLFELSNGLFAKIQKTSATLRNGYKCSLYDAKGDFQREDLIHIVDFKIWDKHSQLLFKIFNNQKITL